MMSVIIILFVTFIIFSLISFIFGFPFLYFLNRKLLVKYPVLVMVTGTLFIMLPLYLIYIINFAPIGWWVLLIVFIFFSIYIFVKDRKVFLIFTKKEFYFPYIVTFIIFIICLTPTIKANLISFLAYNTDLVEHIHTAVLYSQGKYIFSDYPGYHILLAFFYRLSLSSNIVSSFVIFNAFLVSLLFLVLYFLTNNLIKIKSSRYKYFTYFVLFVISLSPLVIWASEDNFAPQLIGIIATPMVVAFSFHMIKDKFSISSIFLTSFSIAIILYSYPAAALSIAALLLIFYICQIKNIKKLIILTLFLILLIIPFYKSTSDFVLGTSSSISSKISINPNISGGFFRRNTLPSLIGIIPVYRVYNGPDLDNPPRLSVVYNNTNFRYLVNIVFLLFIFFVPFLIYIFRKNYRILSLIIGDIIINIFAYFHISPYGDFKVISFNVFVLPFILVLSIFYLNKNTNVFHRVLRNIAFILLVLFLFLSLLASFLMIIDTTHVVIQQKAVNSLYNKVNSIIPKGSKVLFIDSNLNNEIIFKSLMHNYNVFEYNNFNSSTKSLKKLGLGKNSIIDNYVTTNMNIYKNILQYKYIIINSHYMDNYQQFLLPENFIFQSNIAGYDVFKNIYINYTYINLEKVNNLGVNQPYIINKSLDLNNILNIKNINNSHSVVLSLMSFGGNNINVGNKSIVLNNGYKIVKLDNSYLNKELTFDNKNPILLYNISILNKKQLAFLGLYTRTTLNLYNHFIIPNILNNNLNIKVGTIYDRAYLGWFRNMHSFGGDSTYRFSKINSILSVPIRGNYSKLNLNINMGMFGLSNRYTDIILSTNKCRNIHSYLLNSNDKVNSFKLSIPENCIPNNYLELYFQNVHYGNQVLFTNISISKN